MKQNNYELKLNIQQEWKDVYMGKSNFSQLSDIIFRKLRDLEICSYSTTPIIKDDLKLYKLSLIDQFFDLSEQKNTSLKEFSKVMVKLHKWGESICKIPNQNTINRCCEILM